MIERNFTVLIKTLEQIVNPDPPKLYLDPPLLLFTVTLLINSPSRQDSKVAALVDNDQQILT